MTGPLRAELADYLALRRALGYRLARPEKLLGQFLEHLERLGESRITVVAALDWARLPAGGSSYWWGYRLSAVRGFATYLHALDPAHEVPAAQLLPQRPRRASPYLYSDDDITALITATNSLRTPLRQTTLATVIGLLAVTGIRVGEAIALDRGDVDLASGLLVVRHGKFGKARELALHPTTVEALRHYQRFTGPARPGDRHVGVFRVHSRDPTALLQRPPRISPARGLGRAHAALCVVPTTHSRPETLLCRPSDARCLRRRPGRTGPPDAAVHLAGPRAPSQHLLVFVGLTGVDGAGRAATRSAPGRPIGRSAVSALAPTLQAFFTERLIRQRHASDHTISAYRDTLRLLLSYTTQRTGLAPSALDIADLDATLIGGFLDHLETERGNSVRTRNARLAAIHSLFRFAALAHPEHAASISRILAIPPKRFDRALITYLTEPLTPTTSEFHNNVGIIRRSA